MSSSTKASWRRWAVRAVQVVLALVVVYFAGTKLVGEWGSVRAAAANLSPRWSLVIASCVLVLAVYAILIEVWRIVLTGWNARLHYWEAARIWIVSNLGKYVPGKVWQFGAMMVMAQRRGVSGVTAGGSAILTTLTATVVGFAVVAITGSRVLPIPTTGLILIWLVGAALLVLPTLLPRLGALATRITGRSIVLPPLAPSVMLRVIAGSAISWCVYGVAFQVLALGLLGRAPGSPFVYIAVFTGSYLLGFIAVFAPGGLVVREGAMVAALVNVGFGPGPAVILAVASRLWLTVLDILPALVFLATHPFRQARSDATDTDRA